MIDKPDPRSAVMVCLDCLAASKRKALRLSMAQLVPGTCEICSNMTPPDRIVHLYRDDAKAVYTAVHAPSQ